MNDGDIGFGMVIGFFAGFIAALAMAFFLAIPDAKNHGACDALGGTYDEGKCIASTKTIELP